MNSSDCCSWRKPKEKEALDAGADFVGADEYVEKIQKGWLDFDSAIATPTSAIPRPANAATVM